MSMKDSFFKLLGYLIMRTHDYRNQKTIDIKTYQAVLTPNKYLEITLRRSKVCCRFEVQLSRLLDTSREFR